MTFHWRVFVRLLESHIADSRSVCVSVWCIRSPALFWGISGHVQLHSTISHTCGGLKDDSLYGRHQTQMSFRGLLHFQLWQTQMHTRKSMRTYSRTYLQSYNGCCNWMSSTRSRAHIYTHAKRHLIKTFAPYRCAFVLFNFGYYVYIHTDNLSNFVNLIEHIISSKIMLPIYICITKHIIFHKNKSLFYLVS